MKKKSLFKSVAGVLLLAAMSLTSCVQGDLYDDFIDDDMSSESMISRRKFKNDNSLDQARAWVQNAPCANNGECVAATISAWKNMNIADVRNLIGPSITGENYAWEIAYMNGVAAGGFSGASNASSIIQTHCNVLPMSDVNWANYRNEHLTTDARGQTVIDPGNSRIILQLDNQHWGIFGGALIDESTGKWEYIAGGWKHSNVTRALW